VHYRLHGCMYHTSTIGNPEWFLALRFDMLKGAMSQLKVDSFLELCSQFLKEAIPHSLQR